VSTPPISHSVQGGTVGLVQASVTITKDGGYPFGLPEFAAAALGYSVGLVAGELGAALTYTASGDVAGEIVDIIVFPAILA